jgi:DNA polymerase III alpha subunit (gram-positive type)
MTPEELAAIQQAGQVVQVGMQDGKNLKMYNKQRKDNLNDWHRQNFYNSPVQQMARLKEAGLNPALMYGKSGGTGQAMSPVPKTEMATGVVPDLNTGLSYAQLQLMKSQQDNADSQTNLNTLKGATEVQNTALVKEQTAKTGAEATSAKETAKIAEELINASLNAQLADTEGTQARTQETKAKTKTLDATRGLTVEKFKAEVANLNKSIQKADFDINLTKAMSDKAYADRKLTELKTIREQYKSNQERQGLPVDASLIGNLNAMIKWMLDKL